MTVDEHQPLLSKAPNPNHSAISHISHTSNFGQGVSAEDLEGVPTFKKELGILVRSGTQIALTSFLESSFFIVTIVSLGRLGTKELAASSLASMTGNVLVVSIIQGFTSGLDTLCPAAFTSAPKTTSLHCLRTLGILGVMLIPQLIIMWNSRWILGHLGQDPEVARLAALYLKALSFGIPGIGIFECTRRWLQAQGIMHAPTIIAGALVPVNIGLNYLLVWSKGPFGMGFVGAPISVAITYVLMAVFGLLYCYFFAPKEAWGGFTKEALRGWHDNWTLGLAGCMMMAAEWWAWEIVTFIVSMLGPDQLAAQAILGMTQFIFYMPALGASVASSIRIGNLLGANNWQAAKASSRVVLYLGTAVGITNSIVCALNRHWISKLFTNDKGVQVLVEQVMSLVAAWQIVDTLCGICYGIMRGTSKNGLAALATAVSYYGVGIPLAAFLSFGKPDMGLFGTWLALVLALAINCIILLIYVMIGLDFEKAAEVALDRSAQAEQRLLEAEEED